MRKSTTARILNSTSRGTIPLLLLFLIFPAQIVFSQSYTELDTKQIEGHGLALESSTDSNRSDAIRETARISHDERASIIPYYVELKNTPTDSSRGTPLQIILFVTSTLFYLVVLDLIVRSLIETSRGPVRSLNTPTWIWISRQVVFYATMIMVSTFILGPLGGLAVALALASLSIAIETWDTYRNIGSSLFLVICKGVRTGSWIAYRDSVGRVTKMSIHSVELTMHGGNSVRMTPFALLHVSASSWKPNQVRNEIWALKLHRLSNLRTVRRVLTDVLSRFAPVGTPHNTHIFFEDSGASDTIARIESVVDGSRTTTERVQIEMVEELNKYGIDIQPDSKPANADAAGPEALRAISSLRLIKGQGRLKQITVGTNATF